MKYENYKKQNERLKKALTNHFYLEAVFIEYAIMEDRLESILRYENIPIKNKRPTIDDKINTVTTFLSDNNILLHKYFSPEFMASLKAWKNRRNPLIHALMKRPNSTEELRVIAEEGNVLQKDLCKLSQNYKRAVERKLKNENL